jgi:hypothetical protein
MIYTFASSIVRAAEAILGSQLVESIVDLRCNGSARLSWHIWTGAGPLKVARARFVLGAQGERRQSGATKRLRLVSNEKAGAGLEHADQQRDRAESGGVPTVARPRRVADPLPRVL